MVGDEGCNMDPLQRILDLWGDCLAPTPPGRASSCTGLRHLWAPVALVRLFLLGVSSLMEL